MYVTENSVIHIERSEKSVIHVDRAAESMRMTEFSVTYSTCFGPASRVVFLTVYTMQSYILNFNEPEIFPIIPGFLVWHWDSDMFNDFIIVISDDSATWYSIHASSMLLIVEFFNFLTI
jgi:hypothetical protein